MTMLPIGKNNSFKCNQSIPLKWDFTNQKSCKNILAEIINGTINGTMNESVTYGLMDKLIMELANGKHGPVAKNLLKEIARNVSNGVMNPEVVYDYCSNYNITNLSKVPDFVLWGIMNPPIDSEKDLCRETHALLQNYQPERLKSIEVNFGPINQGIPVDLYMGIFELDQEMAKLLTGKMGDREAGALYLSIVKASKGQNGMKATWAQNVLAEIGRRIKVDNDPYFTRLTAMFKLQ